MASQETTEEGNVDDLLFCFVLRALYAFSVTVKTTDSWRKSYLNM